MSDTLILETRHPYFEEVTLTRGLLDKAAEVAYAWGYCAAMMKALSLDTGWTGYWGAFLPDDPNEEDAHIPAHVAIERPDDGILIDVEGAFTRDLAEIDGCDLKIYAVEWRPITWDVISVWEDYPFFDNAINFASSITGKVLDRARDTAALRVVA
jgi:hypothetical protein